MPTSLEGKSAKLTLNTQNQNVDTIHRIVANILGRAGCGACGRVAFLDLHFHGDPGPDLSKEGVVSVHTQGF